MAAVLRPDPKNQIPSRDEREKAEWNGSNPCWLMLVDVGRCWLCSFVVCLHDFSRSGLKIPTLQDVASSLKVDGEGCLLALALCHWTSNYGPFWAQGGSRCAETTSAPVTNEFEETLRRSGARAKGTGTIWYLVVFQFLVDQQVAQDVAPQKKSTVLSLS